METDKDPKQYELAVLVTSEDQLPEMAAFLAKHEATITGEPKVKKLALAHPVKKQREAIFASYLFTALPSDAKKLEQDLAARQDILRSMIINAVPANEHRAPMGDVAMLRRRPKTMTRVSEPSAPVAPKSPAPVGNLSNEALEKRIEEILQ